MVKSLLTLCMALFMYGCGCEQIESTSIGVKKSFGEVKEVLGPGLYYDGLTEEIIELDMTVKTLNADVKASSLDLQRVETKVAVQYSIERNDELILNMFRNIGETAGSIDVLLGPAVQESVKRITAKYKASELLEKREQVKNESDVALKEFMKQTLDAKQLTGLVKIVNVAIVDFTFSEEFNNAIEAKVKAEQARLQAETEKAKRATDAEAKLIEVKTASDADAYRVKQAADAAAYEMTKASEAKALAVKKVSDAMNAAGPNYIRLKWVEKWKGDVPKLSTQSVPMMMVNPD